MKCNNNHNSTLDSKLLTFHVLRRLDCGMVDSFENRIRSQKVQYFAQLFKVSPHHSFNLYLKGPYSPDLANELYEMKRNNVDAIHFRFVSNEMEERFRKLESFIKGKSTRRLELASTLHWLLKIANFPKKEAVEKLVELKNANGKEMILAFNDIKNI